eukprot:2054030-Pleurochrysis_carterae.AAC.1
MEPNAGQGILPNGQDHPPPPPWWPRKSKREVFWERNIKVEAEKQRQEATYNASKLRTIEKMSAAHEKVAQ